MKRVKRNIRLHWLSRRDQLPLRIDEFLWRDELQRNKYCEAFNEMLHLMATNWLTALRYITSMNCCHI